MKAYEIQKFGIDELALVDRPMPEPAGREVLVRIRAASLNYRDLMMVTGKYNPRLRMPLVPLSDGAGEVVAAGSEVTRWKEGDRVCPIFMQGWIDGDVEARTARTALGGDLDGCAREFAVFDEDGLVAAPDGFDFAEAATLPCAAVTAFHALFYSGGLRAGETVLIQGTGGVSIFALQFANAAGARVIVTSSSDEKLARAVELGAEETINYRTNPDWDKAVLELTGKRGVDHVIEVGGAGTLQKSLNSVRMGGHIAVIGVLAGAGEFNPASILMKSVRMQGIFVGSREMFEEMNGYIDAHGIRPVIDRVFDFEELPAALRHMESGAHFGKNVIRI